MKPFFEKVRESQQHRLVQEQLGEIKRNKWIAPAALIISFLALIVSIVALIFSI